MICFLRKSALLLALVSTITINSSAQELSPANYDRLVPLGKEVDAIYGDFAIVNESAKAVIAAPLGTRNANMTVRSVGGCLLDFAATDFESDQLSAFYPGRRKFPFSEVSATDQAVTVLSPGSDQRAACQVVYQMLPGQPVIQITSQWTNTTASDWTLALEDDIRADGGNEEMLKTPGGTHDVCWVEDRFWQQAYAVSAPGFKIRWNSNSRESVLNYEPADGQPVILKPGDTFSFKRYLAVARSLPEALATVEDQAGLQIEKAVCQFSIVNGNGGPIADAQVEFSSEAGLRGTLRSDASGKFQVRLPTGAHTVNATAGGVAVFPKDSVKVEVQAGSNVFDLKSGSYKPGTVVVTVTDDQAQAIPAKVEFRGNGETPTPNWGPESAEHFVRNLAYTENGAFKTELQAGEYDVIVSRGPEYDAVFTKVQITAGKSAELKATLRHSVKTPGWVSSDFHSHSSPSGDNTGSQKGRVLNLAAEHIEFAPCTEHNRVSTYDHHIAELGLKPFLATVSGMELTGQPLPLNHQNAFPMRHIPRTQDGGGPVTDSSPEAQMERLALWDDRSKKLIQQNHPDIGWLFYDKDGDGQPDEGYSRSLPLIDVMEIHPIDRILEREQFDIRNGKAFNNNRMLNWLQLLNQGFRIYGVVNTDAHYNFHGSGWLRNWIQSSTDDPAKIDPLEIVHASEQGRLVMSNGPYLEATFTAADQGTTVVSGQDLEAKSGKVKVHVRVQCANWLNVDTVFLLINGKVSEAFQFNRTDHPDVFADGVVKFDQQREITLSEDSHLIVVTGHRTEILGDVMGPSGGAQRPAALTNPVFVDVDGNGFKANKDTLGYPLPVKFK